MQAPLASLAHQKIARRSCKFVRDKPLVMPIESRALKVAAGAYLGVAGGVAAWAWYIDLSLLSEREHLLPDVVLMICGFPSSLLLTPIYARWPGFFTGLMQTGFLTICALGQSGVFAAFAFCRGRGGQA